MRIDVIVETEDMEGKKTLLRLYTTGDFDCESCTLFRWIGSDGWAYIRKLSPWDARDIIKAAGEKTKWRDDENLTWASVKPNWDSEAAILRDAYERRECYVRGWEYDEETARGRQ